MNDQANPENRSIIDNFSFFHELTFSVIIASPVLLLSFSEYVKDRSDEDSLLGFYAVFVIFMLRLITIFWRRTVKAVGRQISNPRTSWARRRVIIERDYKFRDGFFTGVIVRGIDLIFIGEYIATVFLFGPGFILTILIFRLLDIGGFDVLLYFITISLLFSIITEFLFLKLLSIEFGSSFLYRWFVPVRYLSIPVFLIFALLSILELITDLEVWLAKQ